ncbi:MAG: hypothetical protein PHH77_12295 [Victivallaceae bacterium]|nr:hypothetical protein [Victivallaceae bacterium]
MDEVKCLAVFERAFQRMGGMLFRPFNISKWFVLGFSAWLAVMFQSGGIFGYNSGNASESSPVFTPFKEFLKTLFTGEGTFVDKVCNYFGIEHSVFWLIVFGTAALILVLIAINLALLWLSSRFEFIFIDNLAGNHTRIVHPWTQFKKQGNSAFSWLIGFMVICILFLLVIFTITVFLIYPVILNYLRTYRLHIPDSGMTAAIATMAVFGFGTVVLAFIYYFFNEFVLLIMYRKNLPATVAYREFLRMLKDAPLTFVKFWLLQLVVNLACVIAVGLFVIWTCCVALIPLLLPYLNVVMLLPVLVFWRLQAMELMAALGPEYSPYPAPPEMPAADNHTVTRND